MARVPGLRPNDDRPSVKGGARGRVQTRGPGFGLPGLSPTASPVDTFVRPKAPAQTNTAMQLAESLAAVSPQLQGLLQQDMAVRQKKAEDQANRRIGGMSFEEAQKAVREGSIAEMENPWFKAAFMRQLGERMANQDAMDNAAYYQTEFDQTNGNLDQELAARRQARLEEFGDDPFFAAAYGDRASQADARLNAQHAQTRTERTIEDTKQGVYETFLGDVRQGMADGKSASDIVGALRSRYQGNRELLNVDYKDQDKEMLRVAQTLAQEGELELVDAILGEDRVAADGTVLGPLRDNREFSQDATTVRNLAEREQIKRTDKAQRETRFGFWEQAEAGRLNEEQFLQWSRENPDTADEGFVRSIVNGNRSAVAARAKADADARDTLIKEKAARDDEEMLLNTDIQAARAGMLPFVDDAEVRTPTGGMKTVTADQRRKNAAQELMRRTEAAIEAKQLDPDQAFELEVEAFSASGLENPKWKEVLNAGPKSATIVTTTGDEIPPALKQGVELYNRLRTASPRLLKGYVTADSIDFYETYRVSKEALRLNDDQAIMKAMQLTSDPSGHEEGLYRPKYEQVESAVSDLASNGFVRFFGAGTPPAANFSDVANEMTRLSKFYVRSGLSVEQAMEQAQKRFQDTHTQINGHWVNTADRNIPAEFPRLATGMIEDYVSAHPDEGLEVDDLHVKPNASGAWTIYDSTGLPVEGRDRTFTMTQVAEREKLRLDMEQQKVIDAQGAAQEDRGLNPFWMFDSSPFASSGGTGRYGGAVTDAPDATEMENYRVRRGAEDWFTRRRQQTK